MLQEEVQLWVLGRVDGGLVEGQEDVLQHLLEVGQLLLRPVDITAGGRTPLRAGCPIPPHPSHQWGVLGLPTQDMAPVEGICPPPRYSQEPGHLHEPADVVGVDAVVDGPAGQLVPLIPGAAVDGEPQLGVLVLALLQVGHHLLPGRGKCHPSATGEGDLGGIATMGIGGREGDVEGHPSGPLTLMMWAKYFPETRLSVLMKISRRMDSPMGLYLALNLSKRWKVLRSWQGDAEVS